METPFQQPTKPPRLLGRPASPTNPFTDQPVTLPTIYNDHEPLPEPRPLEVWHRCMSRGRVDNTRFAPSQEDVVGQPGIGNWRRSRFNSDLPSSNYYVNSKPRAILQNSPDDMPHDETVDEADEDREENRPRSWVGAVTTWVRSYFGKRPTKVDVTHA